ncbi:hypothetical protein M9H77_27393 [Catharanthus roseus]|uniref:Uncharacterized protein n=1 Tax=Catharanthus roseus TaxID=4058 RepID=A0ACC0ACK3_CATRO|nr:hypothetical protein M9H77_27393 [Catharanthus roseus]
MVHFRPGRRKSLVTFSRSNENAPRLSLGLAILGVVFLQVGRKSLLTFSSLGENACIKFDFLLYISIFLFINISPPLPSHLSHTPVLYEVYGSAHLPSHSPDTVYDPYIHAPIVRPHIPYRFIVQELLKEFSCQTRQIGVEFFYQMVGAAPQDSSYSILGYTATTYGVSSSEPYIGRHSTNKGFEGDRGLGEEHDRVRSLHIEGEADERVDDDGDDEEQPLPVAPASGFDLVTGKGKGSCNKRPDVAREVPAPTQRRKKVKALDWE